MQVGMVHWIYEVLHRHSPQTVLSLSAYQSCLSWSSSQALWYIVVELLFVHHGLLILVLLTSLLMYVQGVRLTVNCHIRSSLLTIGRCQRMTKTLMTNQVLQSLATFSR